jgi:hypothetical protein
MHLGTMQMLWHRRLAHVRPKALEILPKAVTDVRTMTGKCDCERFIKCKSVRKPFTPTTSTATEPLQLVHSVICGPLETAIGGGGRMLCYMDKTTRHTDEYILKYKAEALEKFKECKALSEMQSGKKVKRLRTDGCGEYTFQKFAEYWKSEGIQMEMTTPYTPQSNGVVERANSTMMEHV